MKLVIPYKNPIALLRLGKTLHDPRSPFVFFPMPHQDNQIFIITF